MCHYWLHIHNTRCSPVVAGPLGCVCGLCGAFLTLKSFDEKPRTSTCPHISTCPRTSTCPRVSLVPLKKIGGILPVLIFLPVHVFRLDFKNYVSYTQPRETRGHFLGYPPHHMILKHHQAPLPPIKAMNPHNSHDSTVAIEQPEEPSKGH